MKSSYVLVVTVIAACAQAGGDVNGGNLTPNGTAATTPPAYVVGECAGSGSKWSDLYRDVFGPTGRPGSCSYQAFCHGTPDADGAKEGIHCFDEQTCRTSLVDDLKLVNVATDKDAPDKAVLFTSVLRRVGPNGGLSGFMPKEPSTFIFPESCIDRMKAWVANGAPAD